MKRVISLPSILAIGWLLPFSAAAAMFLSTEDFAVLEQPIDTDLYVVSGVVRVLEDVKDDVFAAGNEVTIESAIGGDVFAAGNEVSFSGTTEGDMFGAGNFVRVEGTVGDDVLLAGNQLRIDISGADDIMAVGSTIDIISSQPVTGSIYASGGVVNVAAIIDGDAYLAGERVVIRSGSHIRGALKTFGEKEPIIEEGVTIDGEVSHAPAPGSLRQQGSLWDVSSWVRSVIAWSILALLLFYLVPSVTADVVATVFASGSKALGLGFLWLLLTVPAMVLLLVTTVGMPLVVLIGCLTGSLFIIATAFSMIVTGDWLMRKALKRTEALSWHHVVLGVLVYKTLQLIPVAGWLLMFVVTILALGALLIVLRNLLVPSVASRPSP